MTAASWEEELTKRATDESGVAEPWVGRSPFGRQSLAAALVVGLGFTDVLSGQGGKPCGLEMRVLVVSADGNETGLPAITQTLEYLGTPYTTYIATRTPGGLVPEFLSEGCHANFQAVILATGDVGYFKAGAWTTALTPDEFTALQAFEAQFRVRRATWYAFPGPDLGFNWGVGRDTTASPLTTQLTAAGRAVFPYLTLTRPLVIRHAYGYLATAARFGDDAAADGRCRQCGRRRSHVSGRPREPCR